jgi:hypothetical protein
MLRPPPVVSLPDRPECDTSGHPGRLQRQNGAGDRPPELDKTSHRRGDREGQGQAAGGGDPAALRRANPPGAGARADARVGEVGEGGVIGIIFRRQCGSRAGARLDTAPRFCGLKFVSRRGTLTVPVLAAPAPRGKRGSRPLAREPDRQSTPDGVGAECDSVCARLLECHAADGEGRRYRFETAKSRRGVQAYPQPDRTPDDRKLLQTIQ